MIDAGLWKRAQWYPVQGERDWLDTVNREVRAVRSSVGICDVSTLGKIDVQGPDAARLLDFVYANSFSTVGIGRVRYGLMLREDGFVFDDGTAARLGPDHFIMSTTTANAEAVTEHLEFCSQVLRPELDVQFASVTEQWAQFSIAGPRARDLLEAVLDPASASDADSMPHMSVRNVKTRSGIEARVFRLSFSGELGFEIAIPSRFGGAMWEALIARCEPMGGCAYGTEALATLRIEKGHVAGPELNGTTTAHDLGFGKILSSKKDYIGKVMAQRSALTDPGRETLVGVRPCRSGARLRAGALLVTDTSAPGAADDQGRITSAAFSPDIQQWIGLGLVRNGGARLGERLLAYDPMRGENVPVEICAPVFVDPEGGRTRA